MGRWNYPDNFARNVMKMEMAASDMKLREQDMEQSRKDFGGRITVHLAMLAVALVLMVVVVRPMFTNPATEQKKKEYFYQFAAEKMVDYKPNVIKLRFETRAKKDSPHLNEVSPFCFALFCYKLFEKREQIEEMH